MCRPAAWVIIIISSCYYNCLLVYSLLSINKLSLPMVTHEVGSGKSQSNKFSLVSSLIIIIIATYWCVQLVRISLVLFDIIRTFRIMQRGRAPHLVFVTSFEHPCTETLFGDGYVYRLQFGTNLNNLYNYIGVVLQF